MTVSTIDNVIEYVSGGPAFPIPYRFLQNSDIEAVLVRQSGVSETLVLGTQYTLTGAGSQSGGTLTSAYAAGVLATPGATLTISRVMDAVQPTDLRNQGHFLAETHETVFDRLTMLIQQAFGILRRALLMPIGKNYYDAKGRLIKNLGDGQADQDAVNIRTMRDYVDAAIAGVVGGFGWFIQSGAGAVYRTFQSKMRDVVSVKDFGATGNGVTDDTTAFLLAGKGAYVPEGTYVVDTLQLNIQDYTGPGVLHSKFGSVIRLDTDPVTCHYVQRKVMAPRFGWGDTEIYPGAQFAPQGTAYFRHPVTGEESIFINQSVGDGADWGPDEYCRTSRIPLREDGAQQEVAEFTPEMRQSHAHLSVLYENGQIWAYSSYVAPIGAPDITVSTGKGWSKFPWKGAANTSSDIINYQVWGNPGSGHRYERFGKGCAQVSQCGKYMILVGIDYSGAAGGRTLFVYDRLQVESMLNPLDAEPIFTSRTLSAANIDATTGYQGETCDGRYIYILWGSTPVYGKRVVTVHSLTGEKLREIAFEGPAAEYTNAQLRNGHPTLGDALSFEPEGITIRGDEIFVTFVDYWRAGAQVVSYYGTNYVNTFTNNVNSPPDQYPDRWRPTDRAPTHGAWNSGTTYALGAITRREKKIYCLTPPKGNPLESPAISRYTYADSVAQYPGKIADLIQVSIPHGDNWRASVHLPGSNEYRPAMEFAFGYTFNVRDTRTGSDNSERGGIRYTAIDGGDHHTQLFAGDGTAATSPNITMYPTTSNANAGDVWLTSRGPSSILRLMQDGATKFAVNDTYCTFYQNARFITDASYNFGSAAFRTNNIYLVNAPIVTSDLRYKILREGGLDDAVLDVIEDVVYRQYTMLDDIYSVGATAQWRFGVIAQELVAAFDAHGLDWRQYGVIQYHEWDAEPAQYERKLIQPEVLGIDDLGKEIVIQDAVYEDVLIRPAVEAGYRYFVTYDELYALECALMRRERSKLAATIVELSGRVAALEGAGI